MGKYEPLGTYLAAQNRMHIPMSFAEIEDIIGEKLPASKQYPAWWSNSPTNNVMTKEWLSAGYQTEAVDIAGEKLVFRRIKKPPNATSPVSTALGSETPEAPRKRTSIFGCMKGTLTLDPDVDLTEPADPEWSKVYEDG
ncbi:MAG: hypothetical protein WAT70_09165 [Rhizobiaceae bacterium]